MGARKEKTLGRVSRWRGNLSDSFSGVAWGGIQRPVTKRKGKRFLTGRAKNTCTGLRQQRLGNRGGKSEGVVGVHDRIGLRMEGKGVTIDKKKRRLASVTILARGRWGKLFCMRMFREIQKGSEVLGLYRPLLVR